MKHYALILAALLALAACTDKNRQGAEEMLQKAESQFKAGAYNDALHTIDSLRQTFPQEVEARKKALTLYQNVALKQAQDELARTDTMLLSARNRYEALKKKVDAAKAALKATPAELQQLTLEKIHVDSLQTQFDVACAKIKYIHKRQKEK